MADWQAIVVGSGYGSAVAALRLGQAGVQTLVLERGRRWTIEDPTSNATFATFERPDGRAEWLNRTGKSTTPAYEGNPIETYTGTLEILDVSGSPFLAGAGVGGGSLVYGGIVIQPHRELWPTAFPRSVDYDEMDCEYFPRVFGMVEASPIPDDILDSEYFLGTRVLMDQCKKLGFEMLESEHAEFRDGLAKLHMAIDWDAVRDEIAGRKVPAFIAAEFWYGDNSGAKPSLEANYLRQAEATGNVQIRTLHQVTDISGTPDGGYRVAVDVINPFGTVVDRQGLTCERLFLGAGCFGTSKLLLRAKARGGLPSLNGGLGKGFGNDGDVFLIRANLGESTNPHLGGPGCVAVLNFENPIRPVCMMRAPLPRFEQDYPEGNAIGTFVFSNTPKRGTMSYDVATDTLSLDFEPESEEAALHLANRLNEANGGQVVSATKTITGHQLGGACMGMACDELGRVEGYPGLYVVDGALIPGSTTCVNPAATIAAIAERCLDHIVAEDRL
jgi:cholesterol oxidase